MSNQPKWKLIANLGDVNPVDYGGYFVFVDETGVYPPEAEYLEVDESAFDFDDDEKGKRTVYRVILEKCTFQNGVLSDNPFHPNHPAWFFSTEEEKKARPQDSHLGNVAEFIGTDEEELIEQFCSDDPIERAQAYRAVAEYYGWNNFDDYPLEFTNRKEVEARYKKHGIE